MATPQPNPGDCEDLRIAGDRSQVPQDRMDAFWRFLLRPGIWETRSDSLHIILFEAATKIKQVTNTSTDVGDLVSNMEVSLFKVIVMDARPIPENIPGYCWRAMKKMALVPFRKSQGGQCHDEYQDFLHSPKQDDERAALDNERLVAAILKSIKNPTERHVVELHYAGLPYEEIGRLLHKTAGAVSVIRHRAIQKLRKHSGVST